VRDQIREMFNLPEDDVRSTAMGQSGEDVQLSDRARQMFPYSVECKNVEKLNVWSAYEQCESNSGDYEPVLFMKKNRKEPLVVIDAKHFFNLLRRLIKQDENEL